VGDRRILQLDVRTYICQFIGAIPLFGTSGNERICGFQGARRHSWDPQKEVIVY
jgi:hypothetical protein